ncbi:MAG: serine protease [Clostridiales bacterium]|nr:serine protease [Clostridiales bacterium]
MKKFICAAVAAITLLTSSFFAGCFGMDGLDGRDGKDGSDVSIYEIFQAVNEERENKGLEKLEFLDFIAEYLNYDNQELTAATSLKNTINKSLLSAVSVVSTFTESYGGIFGGTEKAIGFGSGVIIDLDKESGDALVVTNCHVVYDNSFTSKFSKDIRLYLYGQDTMGVNFGISEYNDVLYDEDYRIEASIVGASLTYDIAVLKVEGSEVLKRSSAIASSFTEKEYISVGDTVYAIGNASGEGTAATQGIISRTAKKFGLI